MCSIGLNCVVDESSQIGKNVSIGHNVIIEKNVKIGNNVVIESNSIIKNNSNIGDDSVVGSFCVIGENQQKEGDILNIGENANIRSGSIIYSNCNIGKNFQTGHRVTIREKSNIGDFVSIGTLSDIQGDCTIGSYVRLHSNVHIGKLSVIDSFVWIFPYVVLTNDPTPPSNNLVGVHINSFAIVATGALIMPGITIGQDSLVAAGCVVTKDVLPYSVVMGNPAKYKTDVRKIISKITGEPIYPWRDCFNNHMPWQGANFSDWYNNLDENTKNILGISSIM